MRDTIRIRCFSTQIKTIVVDSKIIEHLNSLVKLKYFSWEEIHLGMTVSYVFLESAKELATKSVNGLF